MEAPPAHPHPAHTPPPPSDNGSHPRRPLHIAPAARLNANHSHLRPIAILNTKHAPIVNIYVRVQNKNSGIAAAVAWLAVSN